MSTGRKRKDAALERKSCVKLCSQEDPWGRGSPPPAHPRSRIPYSASSLLALPRLVSRPPTFSREGTGAPFCGGHRRSRAVPASSLGPARGPLRAPGRRSAGASPGHRQDQGGPPHWPPHVTSTFQANEVTVSRSRHFRGDPCHRQHPEFLWPLSDCHLVLLGLPGSPPSAGSPEPAGPSPGVPSSPRRFLPGALWHLLLPADSLARAGGRGRGEGPIAHPLLPRGAPMAALSALGRGRSRGCAPHPHPGPAPEATFPASWSPSRLPAASSTTASSSASTAASRRSARSPRPPGPRAPGPSVTCTALSRSSGPAAASVGPTPARPLPLH